MIIVSVWQAVLKHVLIVVKWSVIVSYRIEYVEHVESTGEVKYQVTIIMTCDNETNDVNITFNPANIKGFMLESVCTKSLDMLNSLVKMRDRLTEQASK